jgi:hypothetical protein
MGKRANYKTKDEILIGLDGLVMPCIRGCNNTALTTTNHVHCLKMNKDNLSFPHFPTNISHGNRKEHLLDMQSAISLTFWSI